MTKARDISGVYNTANTANNLVKLDNTAKLPALDGSLLTGVAEAKPTISSISPNVIDNTQNQIVITGTNFEITPNVELISSTGAVNLANSVTRNSSTQITITTTLATDGTYFIRVENPNGLAGRSSTALLTVSDNPTWSTSAGSLGQLIFGGSASFTIQATSDSSITYSFTGSLPSGLSLNSSTGAITGTENSVLSETTIYNFTATATDSENQTAQRAFSITVVGNYFGDGSDGSLST